ncbi:hypothetical protein Y1Q_0002671 [Alligator mississippiensis]|uniref:Uncharacterized protein n=1 Tax=Alligator mississippiensis TaxID=8496 RepID=A0A151NZK8_ALLMI|nr:hypothetical protein Y1Q_0002671 [Alligator mississippiensis]
MLFTQPLPSLGRLWRREEIQDLCTPLAEYVMMTDEAMQYRMKTKTITRKLLYRAEVCHPRCTQQLHVPSRSGEARATVL